MPMLKSVMKSLISKVADGREMISSVANSTVDTIIETYDSYSIFCGIMEFIDSLPTREMIASFEITNIVARQ